MWNFSERRHQHPDLVALETFDADHTLAWNTDPDRWQTTVTSWLQNRRQIRSD